MGIALEDREDAIRIVLGGSVNIESAKELKSVLLQALGEKKKLSFSFAPDADLDVTAMQLLWAAEHEATTRAIELEFTGPVPDRITAGLNEAGFEPFISVAS